MSSCCDDKGIRLLAVIVAVASAVRDILCSPLRNCPGGRRSTDFARQRRVSRKLTVPITPDKTPEIVHVDIDQAYHAVVRHLRIRSPRPAAACIEGGPTGCSGSRQIFVVQSFTSVEYPDWKRHNPYSLREIPNSIRKSTLSEYVLAVSALNAILNASEHQVLEFAL